MTDLDALAIAAEAAKIPLPADATEGVRARFAALGHLAARVRELTNDGHESENEKLTREWHEMDSAARKLRFALHDIEGAAEKANNGEIAHMARTARLGTVAAAIKEG